jgi:hypothetical protein
MIKTPYLILSENVKQILAFGLRRDVTRCLACVLDGNVTAVGL